MIGGAHCAEPVRDFLERPRMHCRPAGSGLPQFFDTPGFSGGGGRARSLPPPCRPQCRENPELRTLPGVASAPKLPTHQSKMNVSTHPGTACGYPDLPQPLKHGAGARVAGTVYAGLGSAGSAWFGLSLAAPSPTWVARAPFPGTPREQAVAVASAGAVYVFGGL
eukprot:gene30043-39902_t